VRNILDKTVPTNLQPAKAIAAGWRHNVALLTNGAVVAWGDNTYGQTNIPSDLTNTAAVMAIAAGDFHSVALRANGTVEAWGANDGGQTNVPLGLSNVVAIAAGGRNSVALISNGMVVEWGTNDFGQTNVPAGMSNIMAIAAGAAHSVALKNDGTLCEWGDNSSGQATVPVKPPTAVVTSSGSSPTPQTTFYPPIVVKLIAAGGDHTMAAIFSPWVLYPIDVSKDLLLIYNTNSLDSSNVCQYYLTHRPMVSKANVLGVGGITNETTYPTNFTNDIEIPIQNWLVANPTKRPAYVILFNDVPSRANYDVGLTNSDGSVGYNQSAGTGTPSVQYQINQWCATNWHPFVSSLNMDGTGGTNDCVAYINKITNFANLGGNVGHLIISGLAAGYGNTNYYFDDTRTSPYSLYTLGLYADEAVLQDGVSTNCIFYTNDYPDCGSLACHTTNGINVAGYLSWGVHSSLGADYATSNIVNWTGNSGWYIMETIESFNGQRYQFGQGNFVEWFSESAFGGSNYSNTPIGAPSNVNEPFIPGPNYSSNYFGLWANGKNAGICAWNSINTPSFQVVGDPFVSQ